MTTYAQAEISAHGGRPIELYRFVHGSTVWTYSSGPEVTYGGETYAAFSVGRDEIGQTGELHKAGLNVLLPRTCELSLLYLVGNPESVVTLTIYRTHVGISDGPIVYWKGRVVSVEWSGAQARLTCESVFTSLKRPGLRARYQRMCRHALYSAQCGANKDAHAFPGTVAAINAAKTVLTVSSAGALSAGWLTGGMVQTPTGGFLFITGHTGSSLTLANPCGLAVSDAITLYPGCARNRETCQTKFSNILNFGGWPWIPQRNPFDGRSLV
jgi:uncharacterized phage protein (TIGR02218 family)